MTQRLCRYCGADLSALRADATICRSAACRRAAKRDVGREYRRRPDVAEKKALLQRRYLQRPDVRASRLEVLRDYWQRPDVKAAHRKRQSAYRQRPEARQAHRDYNARPSVRQRRIEAARRRALLEIERTLLDLERASHESTNK